MVWGGLTLLRSRYNICKQKRKVGKLKAWAEGLKGLEGLKNQTLQPESADNQ